MVLFNFLLLGLTECFVDLIGRGLSNGFVSGVFMLCVNTIVPGLERVYNMYITCNIMYVLIRCTSVVVIGYCLRCLLSVYFWGYDYGFVFFHLLVLWIVVTLTISLHLHILIVCVFLKQHRLLFTGRSKYGRLLLIFIKNTLLSLQKIM